MSTPQRADAARNRAKILSAARAAFADPQADVSMAEVSRRAGVGMATLYRNFGSRRELLEALYTDEIDAVCAAAEVHDSGTAGGDLMAWLYRFFDFYTAKRHVGSELLRDDGGDSTVFVGGRARVVAAGRPLYDAARRSGEIREDLALDQILDMIISIAMIDREPAYLLPILRSSLDGLVPRA